MLHIADADGRSQYWCLTHEYQCPITRYYLVLLGWSQLNLVLLCFTWFYSVVLSFIWFNSVQLSSLWSSSVLLGFTWLYLVVLVFSWFYLALLGITWYHLILLSFCLVEPNWTWFYLVLLGFCPIVLSFMSLSNRLYLVLLGHFSRLYLASFGLTLVCFMGPFKGNFNWLIWNNDYNDGNLDPE